MHDFRDKAVETYIKKIKSTFPDFDSHTLECMKFAFETGFNLGTVDDKHEFVQKLALLRISSSKIK